MRDLRLKSGAVEQLTARATGDGQTALLAALPPPSDYCNVPMSLARERDCPLAVSRPIDLAARRSERTAAQELDDHRILVASLEAVVEKKRQAVLAGGSADTRRAQSVPFRCHILR